MRTATPTITVTPTIQDYTFAELVSYNIKPAPMLPCRNSKSIQTAFYKGLPAIVYEDMWLHQQRYAYLCLFGFSPDSTVNLTLFDPDQNLVDELEILIQGQNQEISIGMISLALSLDMPHGDWRAITMIGEQVIKSKFTFPDTSTPFLSASLDLSGDRPSPANPSQTTSFMSGEPIQVMGINFPPEIVLPVGIFTQQISGFQVRLIPIGGSTTRVSQNGTFSLSLVLPETLPFGTYKIIPILEPSQGAEYKPQMVLYIQVGE